MLELEIPYNLSNFLEVEDDVELESFHDGYTFRVDYAPDTPRPVLENDIDGYLLEYRLKATHNSWKLHYSRGQDGDLAIRSGDNGESMLSIGKNGIRQRLIEGKSVKKETADLLGMQKLEAYMPDSQEGDTMLWMSPPDPEVGYEYGFLYVGKVKTGENDEKELEMRALRLNGNPTFRQCNEALSILTKEKTSYDTANEFVANPHTVTRDLTEDELKFVLKGVFSYTEDPKVERRKRRVLTMLAPYKEYFIQAVGNNAPHSERRKLLFALENLALKFDEQLEAEDSKGEETIYLAESQRYESKESLMDKYGYTPPKEAGTCDEMEGPAILGYGSLFGVGSIYEAPQVVTETKLKCKCPFCGEKVEAVISNNRITCPRKSECGRSAPYKC